MNLQTILTDLRDLSDETPEDKATRLRKQAETAGVNPETLLTVEDEAVGLCQHKSEDYDEEIQQLTEKAQALAPMLGIPPEEVAEVVTRDTVIQLLGMLATTNPEKNAQIVATLHSIYERAGLYDELDTETPDPRDLRGEVML